MSEPQIAVDVMRTIASREFMMRGSGTSSTRTLFFPCQQLAFMTASSLPFAHSLCELCDSRLDLVAFRRPTRVLAHAAFHRGGVRAHHLARLHHLLERTQIVMHLLRRLFAEQLGRQLSELAARHVVIDLDTHLGAAPAGRGSKCTTPA